MASLFRSWDDAVEAIGPIEHVHGPCDRIIQAVVSWFVVVVVVSWYPIGIAIYTAGVCLGNPRLINSWMGFLCFAWLVVVGLAGCWAAVKLRWRLLVGREGLALWQPGRATCVRWDQFGSVWRVAPNDCGEGRFALERADGTGLVINRYFANHDRIVRRILTELMPVGEDEGVETNPRRPGGDGIRPAEPGIAEPRQ